MSDDKERLAAWMMRQGFATGHGDTTEELLEELSWQVAEIKAQRDELLEALEELTQYVDQLETAVYAPDDAAMHESVKSARAAIAKAKGE